MRPQVQLLIAVPLFALAACTTPKGAEAIESNHTEASVVEDSYDPNDPNVMVCPVTGAIERLDPSDPNYVHDWKPSEDHGEGHDSGGM